MQRDLYDWQHDYNATPKDYPITDNSRPATYDQFIQLRDTLIFTWKYYNDKATRKLCVWDKWDWTTTNTIEVREPKIFRQSFEPNWSTSPETDITSGILPEWTWKFINFPDADPSLLAQIGPLSCQIQREWRYRIIHKEEILLEPTTNKVCCYVDIYRKNDQDQREIPYKGWIAVFDWEWWREDDNTHFKKTFAWTFSWTTSWTDPNGSCSWTTSTVVTLTLGDLIQKMTAFWYMERDLQKGDILVLRMKDKWADEQTGEPQWNDLKLQQRSNYRSIEYIDLPYNI